MSEQNFEKKNIALSAILNIVRRACMIAFPLITYAYATRILGKSNIGIYEFSQSIVSYFSLLAALGITQYAVRDGAKYVGDESAMSDFASEIFSINLLMTIVSYAILFILLKCNPLLNTYSVAISIYSISIMFNTLGVDWINSLYEDYLYLTARYIIVSVISIILLFIFVRSDMDLNAYIFISIFALVANGIMNFVYIRRYVRLRFTFRLNLAKHGLPIFILFCNNIASVVYLNSDITILRILSDDATVGLYGVASKIYTMIKELMNAAIFVTIPRFSAYVLKAQEAQLQSSQVSDEKTALMQEQDSFDYNREQYIRGLRNLLSPLLTVLLPACVGLYFLAANVIYIIAGSDFTQGDAALRILAISLFFAVMACLLAYSVIMPYKLERKFLMATIAAATLNIVLNFILIPIVGMPAAAFTTLLAEIVVFSILLSLSLKRVSLKEVINRRDFLSAIVGSMLVAIVCIVMRQLLGSNNVGIVSTVVTVAASVMVYVIAVSLMGNSMIGMITGKITGRMGHKH